MSQFNGETSVKQQEGSQWGICASCCAEGYSKKKCTGCRQVSYCNTDCQRNDFQRHKDHCKLFARFIAAGSRIDPLKKKYMKKLSFHLGSIPDHTRHDLLGPRICVLVEILEWSINKLGSLIITVRDVDNQMTKMILNPATFNVSEEIKQAFLSDAVRVFLPGNFLLLSNASWDVLTTEDEAIEISDLDHFSSISMPLHS